MSSCWYPEHFPWNYLHVSRTLINNRSPLVQAMSCYHRATCHYLKLCWSRLLSPYGITRPKWVNYIYRFFFLFVFWVYNKETIHWRHNGRDCVSNHQPHDCLLNRLFGRKSKKISKLCVTGLCAGNSPGPVNSPHKWPVTRKMFPFDDIIMKQYCSKCLQRSHQS